MNTLFGDSISYPPGFHYIPDFITEGEEHALLTQIENIQLHTFRFQGFEAKRRVASFGWDWNFETSTLSKGKKIPDEFIPLINKVADVTSIDASLFAELLVIQYPPGAVINWHRDAPPFDVIAGISLLSDCTFKLRPQGKDRQTRSSVVSVPVKRRSLYLMRDEARSQWQHSTTPVKHMRYSITLRTVRKDFLLTAQHVNDKD